MDAATLALSAATFLLFLATVGIVVVGVLQWRQLTLTAKEARAEREAIERMARATADAAEAGRLSAEELRAQRAAARPLQARARVLAYENEAVTFAIENPSTEPMILSRYEVRRHAYRGPGEEVLAADCDDTLGPGDEYPLTAFPVSGEEGHELEVLVTGRPLNGLEQRLEFRFRREGSEYVDVGEVQPFVLFG